MAKRTAKPAPVAGSGSDADADEPELPEAKVVQADEAHDPLRMVKLGGFAFALIGGWLFVIGANKFHITAPVVFVCLGYFAVLMTVLNLWRTGAAVVNSNTVDDWQRPIGARGQLLKEKKTLLKAIKEAEFDFAMGKLSKVDSDGLIRDYRARAIEVIKELDRGNGIALSAKEQIDREVKARIALDAQDKPSKRVKNEVAKQAAKSEARRESAAAAAAKVAPADEASTDDAPSEVMDQMAARESKPTATGESS
jgi:hypothetical protein